MTECTYFLYAQLSNVVERAASQGAAYGAARALRTLTRRGLLSGDAAHALVDVVLSRFPKRSPAVLMDSARTLGCPALSPRCLLEHDDALAVEADVSDGGVSLALLARADRPLGLVSRLFEGGPICDAVQVTPVWADNGSYSSVNGTEGEGFETVEVSLLLGARPEGVSVVLEIFVAGVTFEDGTRTKTLTADDFDEDGLAAVRFIRAPGVTTSVCHRTSIYQDGKLLYTNR